MNYFDQYDYLPDSRRNSNSYSEEFSGVRRKQPRYKPKKANRAYSGARGPVRNDLDSPKVFMEPREPSRSPAQDRRRDLNDSFQRSGPSNTGYFTQRDMPRFVEPEHSGPNAQWHWENYNKACKSWLEKHKLAYYQSRCQALEFENQMLFKQINSLIEENTIFAAERGEMPTMTLPEISRAQERAGNGKKQEGKKANAQSPRTPAKKRSPEGKDRKSSESSTTSDFVCEVTPEWLEFIETSLRHKLSLKQERSEEAKKKKIEDDQKKEQEKKKEEGPTQSVAVRREETLDQLYGKNSALIHKLETSVLLNFNRNCDTLKPELWMAVPLNPNTIAD